MQVILLPFNFAVLWFPINLFDNLELFVAKYINSLIVIDDFEIFISLVCNAFLWLLIEKNYKKIHLKYKLYYCKTYKIL